MIKFEANRYAVGIKSVDFDGVTLVDGENELTEVQQKKLEKHPDYKFLVEAKAIEVVSPSKAEEPETKETDKLPPADPKKIEATAKTTETAMKTPRA